MKKITFSLKNSCFLFIFRISSKSFQISGEKQIGRVSGTAFCVQKNSSSNAFVEKALLAFLFRTLIEKFSRFCREIFKNVVKSGLKGSTGTFFLNVFPIGFFIYIFLGIKQNVSSLLAKMLRKVCQNCIPRAQKNVLTASTFLGGIQGF